MYFLRELVGHSWRMVRRQLVDAVGGKTDLLMLKIISVNYMLLW